MIRTWKCWLGAFAVCALLSRAGSAQLIEGDAFGTARVQPDPLNALRPADGAYEPIWLDDFQPPPGVGVDAVTVPQDGGVGYAVTNDIEAILYRIGRVNRHYPGLEDDGFTSAGAFIPVQVYDGSTGLIAINPRAFVSDNGQGGINFGITARRYSPRLDRVFAISHWLDYDQAGREGYAQYGIHAATIGRHWSLRGNINLPVGESHHRFNAVSTPTFFQDRISVLTLGRQETAYQQFETEFAVPVPYFGRYGFEMGLGYYFLNGAVQGVEDGHGVSTRVEAQVTEDLWANALVTSDGVFGSNLSLNFELTLPNGAPSRVMRRLPPKAYLTASDRRSYRVMRDVTRFDSRGDAISTALCFDGEAIRVAHIDPNAGGGGDGTFENPFNSIAQFEALPDAVQSDYEIILVRPNADNTDTNLDTGITLFDCQRLLGTGVEHTFSSTRGVLMLPSPLDASNPFLTNSGAPGIDVVTLADFNEVSGFTIDGSGGTGDGTSPLAARAINGLDANPFDAGDPTGVRNFNINRNTIQNSTFGVEIVGDATATSQVGIIAENVFGGNALGAVNLDFSGVAEIDLFIEDNIVFAGAGGFGFLPDDGTLIRLGFDDETLAANDDLSTGLEPIGFTVDFFGQVFTDLFVNNNGNVTFNNPLGAFTPFPLVANGIPMIAPFFADVDTRSHGNEVVYGQDLVAGRAAFGVTWEDVDYFVSSAAHGAQLNTFQLVMIDRSDLGSGDFDFEFNYEQVVWETGDASGGTNGLGGNSARAGYTNGVNAFFELPGSAVNGAYLDNGPAATSLVQNSLNSNTLGRYRFAVRNGVVNPANPTSGNGINIALRDDAVVNGSIQRNEISGYQNGLTINGPGNAVGNFNISDNTITGAGQHGMYFSATDNENIVIFGQNNIVTDSGEDGLRMETSGNAVMTVDFVNSQFDDNAGRGVNGKSFDDSTLNFSLTSINEDVDNDGILDPGEDLDGDGLLDNDRSSASNNEAGGIEFTASDTSEQNILIDDVLVDSNQDVGILISATQDSLINATIINSSIINQVDGPNPDLFGDGVFLRSSGTSELHGLIADNLIDGNAGHGVRIQAVEDSFIDLNTSVADEAAGIFHGILFNDITNNGGLGIFIEREGLAVIDAGPTSTTTGDPLRFTPSGITGNVVDTNGGNAAIDQGGLLVRTDGGNTGVMADTNIFILNNEFTNNVGGDGMAFESFGASVLLVEAIGNLVDANEVNGVRVTTNDGSFFGMPSPVAGDIGFPSIFDSNTVTNNGLEANDGAGFLLQTLDLSTLVIDITSIEAAMAPNLFDPTLIAGNRDGIRAEHFGGASVGDFALTSIRVGTAFAFPDPDEFEVEIAENFDDAIDVDIIAASGIFNLNVSDTLMRGGRALGALADPGVEVEHDSSFTIANIVLGGDISDAAAPFGLPRGPVRDPLAGVFDNDAYARAGVVITDFAGDGVNILYENSDSTGSELNFRVFDSLIGQSSFGFNTEDGIDITIDNAGSPGGGSGFDAIIDNTQVIGNGGDGIRLTTIARTGGLFSDGVDGLDGALLELSPAQQTDSNSPPNGIGDTIVDGPPYPNGDSTADDFLNSLPFVLDPAGPNNGWADLTSPDDFVADLQIINGSRIDFNGEDGLHLDVGTATRQRVSLQNSSFSGNGDFEINIETFASFEPDNDDIDRAEGMFDRIGLDPTAKLDLFFGSLNFVRDTPAGFPEPGPTVPAEFMAAVGGEGFNTSSSVRVNVEYLSSLAEGFQTASTFKGAPRPANLFISLLIPEDTIAPPDGIVNDIDVPLPNRFLNFGMPFDEIDFFTNSLPASFDPSRYLNINTP